MRRLAFVAVLGLCVGVGAIWAGESATVPKIEKAAPVVGTQAFESGELKMEEVEARQLEVFLQDLDRRRDYDLSQNDGKPGPDGPYLSTWIEKVLNELKRRGYGVDDQGHLRRPGAVVPWK